jgi:hypothetical protein
MMIEFRLFVKINSPFALLNLALNVNVDTSVVLRVKVTATFTLWLHSKVPGPGPAGLVKIIETNAGSVLSIFHLELSSV